MFLLVLAHPGCPGQNPQSRKTAVRVCESKTGFSLFVVKATAITHAHTHVRTHARTHTHTHNRFTALCTLSGTTRVSWHKKKHSPTHTYYGHQSSLICFLHLLQSMASTLFNLRALQSFSKVSLQVFFGLPVGLAPSTSYSIHFFTQSLSYFHSTCPYHRNLFRCSTEIMSSNPSLCLHPLLETLSCSLKPHVHLTIHMSA